MTLYDAYFIIDELIDVSEIEEVDLEELLLGYDEQNGWLWYKTKTARTGW